MVGRVGRKIEIQTRQTRWSQLDR